MKKVTTKKSRKDLRSAKQKLRAAKDGFRDQWEDLVRQANTAASATCIARSQTNDCQSMWDFEDALPASPAHWNSKRRAKAVATGLITEHSQILGWMDAVSEAFKETVKQLNASQ